MMQTGQSDSADNKGVVTRSLATLNQGIIHNKKVTVPCLVKLDKLSPSTKKIRVRCRNGYYTLVKDKQFYKIEESRVLRTRNRSMSTSVLKQLSRMNNPDPRKGGRYVPFQHGRSSKRPFIPPQQEYPKQRRFDSFSRGFSGQSRDVRGAHDYSTSRNSWQGRGQYSQRETRGGYHRYRAGYHGPRSPRTSGEFNKDIPFGSSMDKRFDRNHRVDIPLSHGGSNRSVDIEHEHKPERKRHLSEQSHRKEKLSLVATYRQSSSSSAERSLANDSSDSKNSTEQSAKDLNKSTLKHKSGTQEAEVETSPACTRRENISQQSKTVSHKNDQNATKLQSSHESPLSVQSARDNDSKKMETSGDGLPNGSCSNIKKSEVKVADSMKVVKHALPTSLGSSKEGSIAPGDSATTSEDALASVHKKKKKAHGVLTMTQQMEVFKREKKPTSGTSLPVDNQTKLSSSLPSNKNDKLEPCEPGNQPSGGSETEEKGIATTKTVSESTNEHKETDCPGSANSHEHIMTVPSDSTKESKSSSAKGSPKHDKQQKMAASPMRDGKRVYSARKTAPSSAIGNMQRKEMLQKQAVLKAQEEARSNHQNGPESKNARISSLPAPSDDREATAVATADKPVTSPVAVEETVSKVTENCAFTPPKCEDLIVLSDTEDGRKSPPSPKSGSPQGAGATIQEPAKKLAKDDSMKSKERAIMKIKENLKNLRKNRTTSPGLSAISRPGTPEEVKGDPIEEIAATVTESRGHSVSASGDVAKETPMSVNAQHIPKSPKATVASEESLSDLIKSIDGNVSKSASSKETDISDSTILSLEPVEKELTLAMDSTTTDCAPEDCVASVGEEAPLKNNSAVIESSKLEQMTSEKDQPLSSSALICSSSDADVHEPLMKEKVIDTNAEGPIDSGELSDISVDLGFDDPNDMDVESADDDILLEDEAEVIENSTSEASKSDGTACEVPHFTTTEAEQEKSDNFLAEKGCPEENKQSDISAAEDTDMPNAPGESPQGREDICEVTEQPQCFRDSIDVKAKQGADELPQVPLEKPPCLEDTPETLAELSHSSREEVSAEGPCAQESSKAGAEEAKCQYAPSGSSSAPEDVKGPEMPLGPSAEQESSEESSVAPGQPCFHDISETPNGQPEGLEEPPVPCVTSDEEPFSSIGEPQDTEENLQSVAQSQEQNDTEQPNSSSKRVRDASQKLEDAEPASKRTKTDDDGSIQDSNSSSVTSSKEKSGTSDAPVVFTAQEWKEFSQSIRDKYEKLVQTFNQKTSAVNEANFRWQQETLRLKKELAEMRAKYSQLHSKLKEERSVSSRSVDVQTVTYRKTRLSRRKKEPLKHISQGTNDVPTNHMESVSGTAQNMQSSSAAGNNPTTSGATSECPPAQGAASSASAGGDTLGVSSASQGNQQTTTTVSKPSSLLQAKRSSFSATLSKAIQSVKAFQSFQQNSSTSTNGSPSPSAQGSSPGVTNSTSPASSVQQLSSSGRPSPQQTPGGETEAIEQNKVTPAAGAGPQDQEEETPRSEEISIISDSKVTPTSQQSPAKPDEIVATCGPNAAVTTSVKTSSAQQQSTPSASTTSPSAHLNSSLPPQSPSNAAPTKTGPDSAAGAPKGSPARKSPSDGTNAEQSSRQNETEVIDLTDDSEPNPAPLDKPNPTGSGNSTSASGKSATPPTMRHATLTTRSPHALVSSPPVASPKATPTSTIPGQRTLAPATGSSLPGGTTSGTAGSLLSGFQGAVTCQSAVRTGVSGASGSPSLSTSGSSGTALKSVVLSQGSRVSAPAVVQKPPMRTVHSTANSFPATSQLRNVNPPSLASAQSLAPIVRSPVVSLQHGQGQKVVPSQMASVQITAPIQIQPGIHAVPSAGLTTAATLVSAPASQAPSAVLQAQAKMQQQQRMSSPQQLQQQQISLQMLQQQRQTMGMHQLPGAASSAAALATRQPQTAWLQQVSSVRPGGIAQQAPRAQTVQQVQQPAMLTPAQMQLQMIRAQGITSVPQTAPFSAAVSSRPQAQGVTQVVSTASTAAHSPTQDQIYAQMVMNQAKAKANALREQQQQQQQREQQQQQQARMTAAQQQSSRISQQQAQRSQLRKIHDDKLEHQQQAQQNQALKRMITNRIQRGEEFQRTLTEKLRDMKQKGINTQLHHSLEQQLKDVKEQDKKLRAELHSVDEALRLHQRLNDQLEQQLRRSTSSLAHVPSMASPSSSQDQQLASKLKHPAELPDLFQLPDFSAARHLPQPLRPLLELKHSQEGIVLSWKMNQDQPANSVEVKQYLLYSYQESEATTPSTELWKKIGAVKALSLPMACTLTQFKSGTTYHFAVCAISKRDCPGQFSNIGSINLP